MKRDTTLRWSQLKVGVLLVVGFVILLWVAFNSDFPSFFADGRPLTARFASVQGLPSGAPVFYLGMETGTVESVDLDPRSGEEPIAVTFTVNEEVRRQLRADAFVRVASFGILGDKYLELVGGDAPRPLPEGRPLPSRSETSFTDLIEPGRETLERVDSLVENLAAVSGGLREGEGTLGRLLTEDELHAQLVGTLAETRATLAAFRTTQERVGTRLASAAGSIDSLASAFREGEGTLNRLSEDPSLYENLNAAAVRLESVLAEVEQGEGLMARLLADPELADAFTGLVVDLRVLLQDMRENPGRYVQFSVF